MYIVFPLGKWGNESDGVVEVCLFPWSKDTLPTIEDIITLFNFHPKLSEKPMVDTSHKKHDDDDDDDNDDDVLMRKLSWNSLRSFIKDDKEKSVNSLNGLEKYSHLSFTLVRTRRDLMNPVTCFLLGHVAPGWVGGVLKSLVCT